MGRQIKEKMVDTMKEGCHRILLIEWPMMK